MKVKQKKLFPLYKLGAVICLFVYLSLLMIEALHSHHFITKASSAKEASIAKFKTQFKSHQANCNICDYLTNNHSHQLNYTYRRPAILMDGTSIKYKVHIFRTSPVFILSCANKGPPALPPSEV